MRAFHILPALLLLPLAATAQVMPVSEPIAATVLAPPPVPVAAAVALSPLVVTPEADGDVVLTWSTAYERGNAGFAVEVSLLDAWMTAGFVTGHGTTTEPQTYEYRIQPLAPGSFRVRLRQVSTDGTEHLLPELRVQPRP